MRDGCADKEGGSMYANMDDKFLVKTRKEASKQAIEEMGTEDGKDYLIYPELKDSIDNLEFEEGNISVMVSNELGCFSFDIPLDTLALEQILSIAIKKMNKIKTMLESLK